MYGFLWALNLTYETELALVRIFGVWSSFFIQGNYVEWAEIIAFSASGAFLVVEYGCHGFISFTASYSSRVGGLCSTVFRL